MDNETFYSLYIQWPIPLKLSRVHPSGSSIYTKTLAVLHQCTTEKMHKQMHVTVLKKTEEMQHLLPCFKLLILGLQYAESLCVKLPFKQYYNNNNALATKL